MSLLTAPMTSCMSMNDFEERQRTHQESVESKIGGWQREIHQLVLKTTHEHMSTFFQAQGVEHYGHTGVVLTDRGLAPAHFDDAAVHEQANGHGGVLSGGETDAARAAAGGEGGVGVVGGDEGHGGGGDEGAGEGGVEGAGVSEEEDGGARHMSYTERAAVHTECRMLVKCIRLVELMVAEALIATAEASAMTLLARMRLSTRYG